MENRTNWRERAQCTDSVGFCSFDDSVPPEKWIEYLTGVVTMEIVAVFERICDRPMRQSHGRYRDPEADQNIFNLFASPPMKQVDEYSTEKYSQADMRLVRVRVVTGPYFGRKIEWF